MILSRRPLLYQLSVGYVKRKQIASFFKFLKPNIWTLSTLYNNAMQTFICQLTIFSFSARHCWFGYFTCNNCPWTGQFICRMGCLTQYSLSDCLIQPPVHCFTVGSRAFSVGGPQVWNCLPPSVDLQRSTREVYWVVSWHLTHQTFRVYTLSRYGPWVMEE